MKRFSLLLAAFLLLNVFAFAQVEEMEPEEIEEAVEVPAEIFTRVETMAEYPGGDKAMFEFIQKNLEYPEYAKENAISGTVYVKFVIGKDGSISDITIIRGIHKTCDDACIRVIKKMPKWIPAEQKGKKVKVMFTLPFSFKLQ